MIAAHEVGQGQAVHHAGDGGLNVPSNATLIISYIGYQLTTIF